MAKIHICKKCGGIAGWDPYFQSWICTRCGNQETKSVTNADRIRAMTDEELADFMIRAAQRGGKPTDSGLIHWFDWLKQETME